MPYEKYDYVVFIDESGDPAFHKLSDGKGRGSDFLNLGAALVNRADMNTIYDKLKNIKNVLSIKDLHFTDLKSHYKKLFAINQIRDLKFVAFSVISNKKTLKEGMNKVYNPKDPVGFYHKNLCFLFERLNQYIIENKIDQNKVLFAIEKNNAVKIYQLRRYLDTIKRDKKWMFTHINTGLIIEIDKNNTDLLFLADTIASSIYHITYGQYFDGKQIIEPRYLFELKDKIYKSNNSIIDNGIKFVHKIEDVDLCNDAFTFFKNLE